MIVLAVDPGAHCGLAARVDTIVQCSMIHNDWPAVWKYIYGLQPNVIVVERFATGGMISRDGLDTVELQGSIFGLAWMMGSQVYVQTPGERTPFVELARRTLGVNKAKIESHAVDALAHLFRWEFLEEKNRQRKPFLNATK